MMSAATEVDFRQLLREDGSRALIADHGVALDAGKSMADEFGWAHKTGKMRFNGIRPYWQPGTWHDASAGASSQVQRVLDLVLRYAVETDPNATLQALMYSDAVQHTEPIHLGTISDWLLRNRPHPDDMHGTKAGPALQAFAKIIADELGVPDIASLAEYDEDCETPTSIIPATRPYVLNMIGDGDPDDYYDVLNLLRALSRTAVLVNLVYVSNQPQGHDVFLSYLHEAKKFVFENVRFVDIGNPDRLDDQEIGRRLVAGTSTHIRAMRDAGILVHR